MAKRKGELYTAQRRCRGVSVKPGGTVGAVERHENVCDGAMKFAEKESRDGLIHTAG